MAVHLGRRSRHLAGQLAETGDCFRHGFYVYILYLRHANAILVILYMGLPITTSIAGQWLNSLISMMISNVLQLYS